jgi:TrmH family RNA methyltransferase
VPSGIVALASRPRWAANDFVRHPDALVIVAVDVQDPGNLGALVRSAEAGGATAVVTTMGGADPFGWKALRGSMGSALRLPVARVDALDAVLDAARRAGCRVVATASRAGTPLHETDLRPPTLVLLGSEGEGLRGPLIEGADERLAIPMAPPVESLNVAVAAGLIVYEARRQRRAP